MPLIADPRYTRSAVVGGVAQGLLAPQSEEASPSFLDVLAAASRQATLPGAAYERLIANRDPDGPAAAPDFDPLDHIAGYEDHAKSFIDADSPAEVSGIKARIDSQRRDRDVLRRAGLGGPVAEITMNLLDPSFLAAIAVPELTIAKGARMARTLTGALQGATVATAYEAGMQALQEERSLADSGIDIAGGALLGGILGTLGRSVPEAKIDPLRDAIRRALEGAPRSEVGAAASGPATTLAQESIATGGRTFEKLSGLVPGTRTDLGVVLRSDAVTARQVLQELADVAPLLEKNVEGIATPTSVEALVQRHQGRVADFIDYLGNQWQAYRQRVPRAERMSRDDFYAGVAGAARRGDQNLVPEIAEAARYLRARVFDPLKVEAQQLGLLPADVQVVGAESYFRRMYDRERIRAERRAWDELLTGHFSKQGVDRAEARSIAEDVTRRILGSDVGVANFNIRTYMPDAGPLHERVLDIPDEVIERYLVNDPVKVASAYVRELAPQIEVTRRFGDKDMQAAFQKVRDEYDVIRERVRTAAPQEGREAAKTSKELSRLEEQERQVLEALRRIRDRVYGRTGRLTPDASTGERKTVKAFRGWRNLVAASKLGGVAVTGGVTDLARVVAEYGFLPTMRKAVKLAVSPAFRALSRQQARRMGAAVEVTLARRVNAAFDAAHTEGWTQRLAEGVYKWSGLNHVTDFNRTLAATLLEDKILQAASDVVRGRKLPKWTRTRLAALGLDEDALRRIQSEVSHHGRKIDGVRVSGSANWDDGQLASIYDAAIVKESKIVVPEPGAADRVWWMDSETGRVLGQIKSFALAAPTKIAIAPFQLIGQRRPLAAARFIGAMMIGGYLAHVFRQLAAGYRPVTDPEQAAAEAFVESGMGGLMPDLISPAARRFGFLGESVRYSDRNVVSAYGGPAIGTLVDAYDLLMNRTANGMSARDLHMLRRLLPYQNVWFLRRAINALEGETGEALGLEGAEHKTFGQRFTETDVLPSAQQRGGTGTGRLAY